jgi:hypothetical protein
MKNKLKEIMKHNSQLYIILIDEIRRKKSQLKRRGERGRENESIRLKIDYETQFSTDLMLNDNEINITS